LRFTVSLRTGAVFLGDSKSVSVIIGRHPAVFPKTALRRKIHS
jgi:hypothetical protein